MKREVSHVFDFSPLCSLPLSLLSIPISVYIYISFLLFLSMVTKEKVSLEWKNVTAETRFQPLTVTFSPLPLLYLSLSLSFLDYGPFV